MPEKRQRAVAVPKVHVAVAKIPRSYKVAARGVRTAGDLSSLLSDLIFDLADYRISPSIAYPMIYASGKMLRVVDVRQRHGTSGLDGTKMLNLMA